MHSILPNNQVIFATAGYDYTIRFWEAHSGICYKVLSHNVSQVNCMAIYPSKKLLATGGFQNVSVYETMSTNQHAIYNVEGTVKNTIGIGFSENGSWMYTGGEDKSVKLWDMKELFRSKHIKCINALAHSHPITCVALHPNQVDFMIGDEAGNLLRWDIRSNQPSVVLNANSGSIPQISPLSPTKSAIRSISINQEGNMMAIGNNEGTCWVWSLTGGFGSIPLQLGREDQIQPHRRYALKVLFSPDSTLLATSSADGTAKIWRTVDFGLESECKVYGGGRSNGNSRHATWVWDMAFTCDSEYLLTASSDKLARLWSVKTGEVRKEYVGHQKPVVCLAYSDAKS
jgi:G protein beta subunit-like protein